MNKSRVSFVKFGFFYISVIRNSSIHSVLNKSIISKSYKTTKFTIRKIYY